MIRLLLILLLLHSTATAHKPGCRKLLDPSTVTFSDSNKRFIIRAGHVNDFKAIIRIGNQHRDKMGQVLKHNLRTGLEESSLLVAEIEEEIIGFVLWHLRLDGWRTIYDLGVHRDYVKKGVGQALLQRVPKPIQLKVVADNTIARNFFKASGMKKCGYTESRTGRKLIIFRTNRY